MILVTVFQAHLKSVMTIYYPIKQSVNINRTLTMKNKSSFVFHLYIHFLMQSYQVSC